MAHNNDHPVQNNSDEFFFSPVHFQIPPLVCSSTPTLAPGGGAEVIPISLLSHGSLATNWFSNNGFTPHPPENQHPQNEHRELPCTRRLQRYHQSQRLPVESASAPFGFESYPVNNSLHAPTPLLPRALTTLELSTFFPSSSSAHTSLQPPSPLPDPPAPSPLGLPLYSTSGFDLLSILTRVATRPHPRVTLGPVDMTCSFVVVDVRRYDHPIVYCSPSFCRLTGYSESEILGRNCRFLQAPSGQVRRGEHRHYTSQDAVVHLKKNLSADKECQTSIINFKKDGSAFLNLVTVIPILGGVSEDYHEESEVVYHVGFQVNLTEQPNAILDKLRDGSYVVDYSSQHNHIPRPFPLNVPSLPKERRSQAIPPPRISRNLKRLLADPDFLSSIPISSTTTIPPLQSSTETDGTSSIIGITQMLNLLLLEATPDFIHVVSLKGNFLYVAPSVRRVLGYEPEEMVGKSISDYAHPEDVVPLMRELKEGSATGLTAGAEGGGIFTGGHTQSRHHSASVQIAPRTVDLLFRARTKAGVYVWVECTGRLHVEPGKGRKAIILSGRAKEMPEIDWGLISRGGGLSMPIPVVEEEGRRMRQVETEVWGMMTSGISGGVISFLVVGAAVTDVLGWDPSDLVGREVVNFVAEGAQSLVEGVRLCREAEGSSSPRQVYCRMRRKDGSVTDMIFVLYCPKPNPRLAQSPEEINGISPAPLIYQLRMGNHCSESPTLSSSFVHPLDASVFESLDTSRGSSWQYELQQIKFANQRLEDEIAELEKQLSEREGTQQKVLDGLHQQRQRQLEHYVHPQQQQTPLLPLPTDCHPQYPTPPQDRVHCPEQLPLVSNATLSHHYHPTICPSPFYSSHTQPQMGVGLFDLSASSGTVPILAPDWISSTLTPNLGRGYTHVHSLKRPWDIVDQ